ncbi:hypothetical protein Sste5346_005978 [Sporothrix stenoceras]|uniref:Uncharacterized protein n=1 Tax=Sporothrix stenoceras TaxID=5173 RepID=A0ABR3Z1V9_9PEZI
MPLSTHRASPSSLTPMTRGFVCMPEEFKATIRPRSVARKKKIIEEWETAAKENLDPVTKQWLSAVMDKDMWKVKA